MRKLFLSCFILLSSFANGQERFIQYFLDTKITSVDKITQQKDSSSFYLASPFANSPIDTNGISNWILNYNTTEIELIYTRYKLDPGFSQRELNRRRILNLLRVLPEIPGQNIRLKLIEQTGCISKENGPGYFHGFRLTGEKRPDENSMLKEINFLNHFLKQNIPGFDPSEIHLEKENITETSAEVSSHASALVRDPSRFKCPEYPGGKMALRSYIERNRKQPNVMNEYLYSGYVETKCYLTERGEIKSIEILKSPGEWPWMINEVMRLIQNMPVWEAAAYDGVAEANFLYLNIYIGNTFQPVVVDCEKPASAEIMVTDNNFNIPVDTIINAVLNRNKQWNKLLIVCDITGSMSKYNAMLLKWLNGIYTNSDSSKIEAVSFFNDGDQKTDKKKKVGNTGGIYTTTSRNFITVVELMENAMMNGGGGDLPENNIEAVIKSQQQIPSADDIIMVADNAATPRDVSLISNVNKPIHIILCATDHFINPDYLNLARKTKGSVHFKNQDITDLHTIAEGEVFEINGNLFTVSGGQITYAR